jgi:pimeloyl-ACP methyl ester carboxylesterase
MGRASGFDAVFRATLFRRYVARSPITAPTTIAFGGRDRVLLKRQSRHLNELPRGTQVRELPRCGHVPMADDPQLVAGLIAAASELAVPAD